MGLGSSLFCSEQGSFKYCDIFPIVVEATSADNEYVC